MLKKTPKDAQAKAMKKPKESDDPFERAKVTWNDRLGRQSAQIRKWQLATLLSLGISIPAVFFALSQSGQTKVVPYIVEVDNLGNVRGAGAARRIEFKEEYIIEAAISNFIVNYRGVTVDGLLQQDRIETLYKYIGAGSGALTKINTHFQTDGDPFTIAQTKTVAVNVVSINKISTSSSYNVEWLETDYDRSGFKLDERRYQGILTYIVEPPTNEALVKTNPLGVFVIDIDYSEKRK